MHRPGPNQLILPEPPPAPGKRPSLPRSFLWALLAAGLLAAGIAVLLRFSPSAPAPHSAAAALPPQAPILSTDVKSTDVKSPIPAAAAPVIKTLTNTPLTVTLSSADAGKHVRVGHPVMVLAYADLPPGASATVAVSYTRNHGPQALLALVQGSLATISWTPVLPGQYEFTASAMDARKKSAFSHPLLVAADAAPAPLLPLPVLVPAPPPPARVAAAPPRTLRARPRRPFRKRALLVQTPVLAKAAVRQPAASSAYHVAAGAFIVRPVAETLAEALRQRGYHASVRPGPLLFHKQSYVVQTGSYLRQPDADRQRDTLKRSGYPAYIFRQP